MTEPSKCHCGSISWERSIEENRYTCCSCKRPLWQPIETAPKDGTIILVSIKHNDGPLQHDIVWWNDYYDYWESAGYEWKPVKYDEVEHIFHWMHLPDPPK